MLKNWKSSSKIAMLALIGVCAVWGSTFVAMQKAIERMPVMDFLAIRFTVAALVMIALRPAALKGTAGIKWKHGVWLGIALGGGFITQTFGLLYASATVSGFITGMYVVLAPAISWLILRRKVSRNSWIAVGISTVGLAFLSLHGWALGLGEVLTLACAVFFAVHIIGLGEWSSRHDSYGLAVIQIGTVAVITGVAATADGFVLPQEAGLWGVVALTAVLATALAFLVQTWAQSLVSPTRAAVVMTMEPVFAGIFGVIIAGNQLTPQIVIGGTSILAAMLIVNLKAAGTPRIE